MLMPGRFARTPPFSMLRKTSRGRFYSQSTAYVPCSFVRHVEVCETNQWLKCWLYGAARMHMYSLVLTGLQKKLPVPGVSFLRK
jgi:hypothetical protein